MKSEQLQKWALVAEVVGALAVVVSLGIVTFELNQSTRQQELNTNALEIAAYQELINIIIEINSNVVSNPDLRMAELGALSNPSSLTEDQRRILSAHYINIIRHGDMAYFQFQRGTLDEFRLRSVLGILIATLSSSTIAYERWDQAKPVLDPSFVAYIENQLASL